MLGFSVIYLHFASNGEGLRMERFGMGEHVARAPGNSDVEGSSIV